MNTIQQYMKVLISGFEQLERTVSSYLADLECEDYQVFNDLLVRDGNYTTQIDHIILSRHGGILLPATAGTLSALPAISPGLGVQTLWNDPRTSAEEPFVAECRSYQIPAPACIR